jgi:hypothetical protein
MRIIYVPLEPYVERYTLQLREWNIREFIRLKIKHTIIDGDNLEGKSINKIHTGLVLDAHQRSFYALSQSQQLVQMHYNGKITSDDFILFEDMFHPGIEALAYCVGLSEYKKNDKYTPKVGVRCLAQTIDPDDFVHYTGLAHWMRHYEQMVCAFVDIVFMNSAEMIPFMTAAGWNIPVAVTGVPFGKQEILERQQFIRPFEERPKSVVFTSRIADEKQPEFFIAVAKKYKSIYDYHDVKFAFLSGGRISSPIIDKAVIDGIVEVYPDLAKASYYEKLAYDTRVLLNCSLQDWCSITIPEADALGCNVLAPAYRSFSELFDNDRDRLYIPWSVDDAVEKLEEQLCSPSVKQGKISDYQDKSIERQIAIIADMMGEDSEFDPVNPVDTSYRKNITKQAVRNYK